MGFRRLAVLGCVAAALGTCVPAAHAAFPYHYGGTPPNDLTGSNVWKFAATPEPNNEPVNSEPQELYGVRGAHVADADPSVATAWQTTTGRPDVTIAVLDSGIKWNDPGAMNDLRRKVHLNAGELPVPNHDRSQALEQGVDCSTYRDAYDANGDGVFNVEDYACDSRVNVTDPRRAGPPGVLTPEDLIIAFSDGTDADHNGYVDDIAGWDFLDDDNDPYDDVQYGHGTGEAEDSTSEADNGGGVGTCPNCMVMPLRVGDSFIADVNRFATAALYAVDNGALVIQEALGTLNENHFARTAIDYAYRHGVAVIASAADEAAQHHNEPSNLPHAIVVNSVTMYDSTITPQPKSYLQLNGCTNFGARITLSIPSTSCSSNATGLAAGMAGLVYSAALDAIDQHRLAPAPDCRLATGGACPITANEVRQLLASGTVDGTPQADDVDFAPNPEPSCSPLPLLGCTNPNLALQASVDLARPVISPLVETHSYPARGGFDQFYGYGRVNAEHAVQALEPAGGGPSVVPPSVEITSPDWFAPVDPRQASAAIGAQVSARGGPYTCRVEAAPGAYPNNRLTTDTPPGDFAQVASSWCDGKTVHTAPFDGTVAQLDLAALKRRFPADAGNFEGRENGAQGKQTSNGRPDDEPYGFTVRVIAQSADGGRTTSGQDRRTFFLHHDQDLLPGFPKQLRTDGDSSPVLADLNGDNRDELIFATSDGTVHAMRPDGTELPGWPVHDDRTTVVHPGARAYQSGEVSPDEGSAILGSVAVGDIDGDGRPEVVAADMDGHVYAWNRHGERLWMRETNPAYSGKPQQPFVNVRDGKTDRTQHGVVASPVLADLDGDGKLETIVAGMDRHVYAWHADGSPVAGFPVLVVDYSKVASIAPQTDAVTFKDGVGANLDQGKIVDTPAVGDINGDGKPEIVVGTNEEYQAAQDGGLNAGNVNTASLAVLGQTGLLDYANSRVYAIRSTGDPDGPGGASPFLSGWPFKAGDLFAELLPVVGDGITGNPVIGPVDCPSGGSGSKVGVSAAVGPLYALNPDGTSCLGKDPTNGHDIAMQSDVSAAAGKYDDPVLPAVGNPAFGTLGSTVSLLAPAAGVIRALDLAANEYQGGQDFIAAWDPSNGQFRANFPQEMNDLQFLTGPAVADIDGQPGQEVLEGSASLDLEAYDAAGLPVSDAWPKLTTDWLVATPTVGSFGAGRHKVVVAITRSGVLFAYRTPAPACSPSSSPRFHHDNANSGDYARDAVAPGHVYDVRVARVAGDRVRVGFTAPGDDLLCGTADHYVVLRGGQPMSAGVPAPAAAGTRQSIELPARGPRRLTIQAVDEQGNRGVAQVVRLPGGP